MTTGDTTRQLNRSYGSFELAFAPLIMALIGLWLDHRLGTTPLLVIALAVFGAVGAAVKVLYTYRYEMAAHAEKLEALRHPAHTADAAGTSQP